MVVKVEPNPKILHLEKLKSKIQIGFLNLGSVPVLTIDTQASRIQCIHFQNLLNLKHIPPTSVNFYLMSAISIQSNCIILLLISNSFNVFCISNDRSRKRKLSSPELFLILTVYSHAMLSPGVEGWEAEGLVYFQLISDNCQISMSHLKLFILPSASFF